jgi:quinolinate synthase
MAINEPTVEATRRKMEGLLSRIVPPAEIRIKAELVYEINRIKAERGAIILGHNYMEPALFHTVPDIVGDSLQLSAEAARTEKSPIVFCGVRFMAETAKILNPNKLVLLPAKVAGCSLAESITAEDVRRLRAEYPGVPIVTYINTYADVKAEVDVCCTSSNAARVVQSLDSDTVIFLPDEYLGRNVAAETGKTIIFPFGGEARPAADTPTMIGWRGRCEVHEKFTVEDINNARKQFPGVVVVSHPECSPEVVAASDFASSTTKMVEYVKKTHASHFLVLTECSMGDNIIAENPDKDILRLCNVRCPHMNEITLEDTLAALKFDRYEITVPEDIRVRAKRSLDKMLEIGARP